jgi:hypothetical protein
MHRVEVVQPVQGGHTDIAVLFVHHSDGHPPIKPVNVANSRAILPLSVVTVRKVAICQRPAREDKKTA